MDDMCVECEYSPKDEFSCCDKCCYNYPSMFRRKSNGPYKAVIFDRHQTLFFGTKPVDLKTIAEILNKTRSDR